MGPQGRTERTEVQWDQCVVKSLLIQRILTVRRGQGIFGVCIMSYSETKFQWTQDVGEANAAKTYRRIAFSGPVTEIQFDGKRLMGRNG